MFDRIPAVIAYAIFVAFFAILIWKVQRPDLGFAILVGVTLAGYDIWRQLFARRK